MKRVLLSLAALLLFTGAAQVLFPRAETPPLERVALLRMEFWPEFDRPAMLVIYRITLPPDATLPGRLSLRIPTRAGRPHAVAHAPSPDETLINAAYEYQGDAGSPWAWLHIQVEQPYVQVEYYDPALEKEGTLRSFVHEWPGDLEVDRLIVHVQKPWNATDLQVHPPLEPIGATDFGLEMYEKDLGSLPKGTPLQVEIRYHKPDEVLTVEHLEAQQKVGQTPPGPEAKPDTGWWKAAWSTYLPWVLTGLGLLVLGMAGWVWWKERSQPTRGRKRGRPGKVRACPVCHARSLPDARYCHRCGAPLV